MFTSTTKAIVTGASAHKGTFEKVEKGEKVEIDYDYLKFHTQMQIRPDENTKAQGFATVECRIKDRSSDYDQIFGGYKLPVLAEVEYMESTKGDGKIIKEYLNITVIKEVSLSDV